MTSEQNSHAGFALMESLAALMILAILLPLLGRLAQSGYDEVQKRVVAAHLRTVITAAASYVRKNHLTLATTATATTAVPVSFAQLAPFLPAGFQNQNGWGQTYSAFVVQPTSGQLQAVVLTYGGRATGREFQNLLVPSAAALTGGAGGFVPSGDMPGQPATELRGAFGGYRLSLSGTNIPNPGPGHLGGMAQLSESDLGQDFLYRVAVPGHPELNAMTTDLDMTDHAVRGVSEVQFTGSTIAAKGGAGFCNALDDEGRVFLDPDEGLYVCRGGQPEIIADTGNSQLFKSSQLAVDGELIPKPLCPVGVACTPQIFVAPAAFTEGPQADAMAAVQTWATDMGTNWQVHLRIKDVTDTWISPPPDYGKIMVLTTCN